MKTSVTNILTKCDNSELEFCIKKIAEVVSEENGEIPIHRFKQEAGALMYQYRNLGLTKEYRSIQNLLYTI